MGELFLGNMFLESAMSDNCFFRTYLLGKMVVRKIEAFGALSHVEISSKTTEPAICLWPMADLADLTSLHGRPCRLYNAMPLPCQGRP